MSIHGLSLQLQQNHLYKTTLLPPRHATPTPSLPFFNPSSFPSILNSVGKYQLQWQ